MGFAISYLGKKAATPFMTKTSLTISRVGLILWLIAQITYSTTVLLFGISALSLFAFLFLAFAVLLANFTFQYFSQAYDSTLAKVTFIMTLVGVIGLLIAGILAVVGIFFPAIMLIAALLTLFVYPALTVFYLLWAITFIVVRERVDNPSLMLAGGILSLIGAISALFLGLLAFVGVIGILLVTIVMFQESGA